MWQVVKKLAVNLAVFAVVLVAVGGVQPMSIGGFYEPEIPAELRK